jgi:predicted RNase H-like nuclease
MQSYEITEKKLSLQAWNITPKIRLLDRLLQQEEGLREKVFESHPELLFMILNGGQIYQKKKTKRGLRHRLDLITALEPVADDFFRDIKEEFRRNEVAEDDIVDAMVLALAAKETVTAQMLRMPEEPDVDETGLLKAIHYLKRFREPE